MAATDVRAVKEWAELEHQPVSSASIESIGYDPSLAVLQILFVEGELYEYFMVPQSTYVGLLGSASKGRFFGEFIRDKYRFEKIWRN